jgi:uncharacterized protein
MGIELRPLGVACNIRCHYCYQNPQRDVGRLSKKYDMVAMKSAIEKEGDSFILFGGEPLLVPEADLEDLWAWGWEKFQKNGIQTNGALINESHIQLFKKYRVHVGISIDGPGELNDVRWAGSLEGTRRATARTEAAIRRLCEERMRPSIIVTLHRCNAVGERLERLTAWLRELDDLGIRAVRLHILEVDNPITREKYTLTTEENIETFLHFAKVEGTFKNIRFDVFNDIRNLLTGADSNATCIWQACDPFTTSAVRGIEGHGQRSNCGRTNKEGVDFVKADRPGYERYISLYYTSQEAGGCKGCRYFLMCKGQCPGTSINGDWRNRSEHCLVWKELFEHFEKDLNAKQVQVISDQERTIIEPLFIKTWAAGNTTTMAKILPLIRGGPAN